MVSFRQNHYGLPQYSCPTNCPSTHINTDTTVYIIFILPHVLLTAFFLETGKASFKEEITKRRNTVMSLFFRVFDFKIINLNDWNFFTRQQQFCITYLLQNIYYPCIHTMALALIINIPRSDCNILSVQFFFVMRWICAALTCVMVYPNDRINTSLP